MPELVIIFSFVLVVSFVALAFGSSMHKRQLEYKERKEALEREQRHTDPSGSNERIKHLEDRVRVLERLATDRGATLADEIEALRDERSDSGVPLPSQRDKELS
ncbi:MAG: hypothetical protein ACX930_08480 [Erythrobacter sp.]